MRIEPITRHGILAVLVFAVLFASAPFLGCGDDGDAGEPGARGAPGPGALANETCVLCHAEAEIADLETEHAEVPNGSVTVTVNSVVLSDDGAGNLQAVVDFDFVALDAAGSPVTIDLFEPRSRNPDELDRIRFSIARLIPGTNGDADWWADYGGRNSAYERELANLAFIGGDNYTYTFTEMNTLFADFDDTLTHRVVIQASSMPVESFTSDPDASAPLANSIFDFVPAGGASTLTKEVVTIDACNTCHDALREHGSRVETRYCVVCHNPTMDNVNSDGIVEGDFAVMIHKIHTSQTFEVLDDGISYAELTFPQDERNCTKCHQGGFDSDNWKTRPTIEACGACHGYDIFSTGVGHDGGVQTDNTLCATCHSPALIEASMATENVTPNNPQLPPRLSEFEYFIDDVTVDPATGVASVDFRIERDGASFDLQTWEDGEGTTFTDGSPSFLLAWALPQDGVSAPADYTNTNSPDPPSSSNGNGAGDAASISIGDLWADGDISGGPSGYTATISSLPFPAGATMRAVALQSYFTQIIPDGDDADTDPDEVGRHTPSVVLAVPGDAVRRQVVKSGYDAVTGEPFGCLECHETLELHGGSRVNNPQVCVMCHNPNKSSSGRTVDPDDINPDVVDAVGSDPLTYPEATNNLKTMVHGIHAATERPYEFVRNRRNGFYYNWSHVTFPGNLANCEKCHLEGTYRPENLPAGVLWDTERTTTGDPAETRDDIIAARSSVPNLTDLVDSPTAGACYYCHDDGTSESHILLQGGQLGITREHALELP